MIDKIKKFLRDLIQGTFAICLLAVALHLLNTPIDFDGGAEEVEAKAEAASYKAELQQKEYNSGFSEGYDRGFSEGYDQGYHWGYEEGKDYGYDAGYEGGYIQCLEDNKMEWKIDKFLEGK